MHFDRGVELRDLTDKIVEDVVAVRRERLTERQEPLETAGMCSEREAFAKNAKFILTVLDLRRQYDPDPAPDNVPSGSSSTRPGFRPSSAKPAERLQIASVAAIKLRRRLITRASAETGLALFGRLDVWLHAVDAAGAFAVASKTTLTAYGALATCLGPGESFIPARTASR